MYIGSLKTAGVSYTRAGGKIPFAPERTDPRLLWRWPLTMLTPVEIHMSFDSPVFAASVCFNVTGAPLSRAEVLIPDGGEGRCIAARDAQGGASFGGDVVLTTARRSDHFIIRLTPVMQNLDLSMPEVIGYDDGQPVLYPTPSSITYTGGRLCLCTLAAKASEDADCAFAGKYLAERLAEQWDRAAEKETVSFCKDTEMAPDAYTVTVNADGVKITSSTRLGLLYGVERLMELSSEDGVLCCTISDTPYKPMRGFHFGLPPREEIPFMKRLLRTILIPGHYNQLFMEFAGGMRFDSHPEISEAWLDGNIRGENGELPPFPHGSMNSGGRLLEKEEVRDFCEYAKELGFELIPEVQSFGHVQYITFAHPDIGERDDSVEETKEDTRLADQPPSKVFAHSYCPSNPKSLAIIFDLIDEIVDVVRPPRFVHMGHDEIYEIGLCPKCKGTPHDVLYERHIKALHEHLAKKGLRMMIWADMLQPTEKRYSTCTAIDRLPKDIVLLDFIWYFHFELDMEDHLLPSGYEVLMGNLYSSHYPRYESRAAKERMIGGQVSTWCRMDEYTLSKKGKLYDLLYTAEMLWSPSYRENAREAYADILAKRIPALRDRIHGEKRQIARAYAPIALPEGEGKVACSIADVCSEASLTPRRLSTPLSVPVGCRADALCFRHATLFDEMREAWKNLVRIGCYTVRYADGTECPIDVEFGYNIYSCRRRWSAPQTDKYYRHQGYMATWCVDPALQSADEDGRSVTVLAWEWVNPHPDKEIVSVECEELPTSAAGIILAGVDTVTYKK